MVTSFRREGAAIGNLNLLELTGIQCVNVWLWLLLTGSCGGRKLWANGYSYVLKVCAERWTHELWKCRDA